MPKFLVSVADSTEITFPCKRGFLNEEHHIAFRLTSFGNENTAAGESSGSAPTEALDEEEDELNSLLRERRRWIEERRASDTNGSVLIKKSLKSWQNPTSLLIRILKHISFTQEGRADCGGQEGARRRYSL